MSYESPINLVIGQFRMEQEKRIEGEVFKAIQEYGITIDKEELIRALQYDRGQYDKGYEDGYDEGYYAGIASIFDAAPRMTNFYRIKAMTIEELAKFIATPCECEVDPQVDGRVECGNELCIKRLIKYLESEVNTNG